MRDDGSMRTGLIERVTTWNFRAAWLLVGLALLIAVAGAAPWPQRTGAEQGQGPMVTLDGWPRDSASATVWLDDGRQVEVELGVPTRLGGAVQAAVLARSTTDPLGWAECSIRVDGALVSTDRVEMPDAPASCSWPQ